MKTITASQIDGFKGRVIDVRSEFEFAGERLPGSECVPLPRLSQSAAGWDRHEPLLLMCKSGMRSKQAYDQLAAAGFANLTMLTGGIEACKKAGLDVVVVRRTIPIIRQVMIVAGGLILLGLFFSRTMPGFILLSWFVAFGMAFAGVTGWCPMAKLLEKMPWNKVPAASGGSCCAAEPVKQG